ncbi:MAG: hypothetical protein HRT95_03720 [Moritella sp.]|uniref:hypothetical protein n=1 Tax=Moritella sp. TaxID=78556 RepID=UPI001DDDF4EC|nr:hypothetical protein [Moritella sp.]NQZ49313.1 hypothetical protein [Moritella sp.]
MGYMRTYGDASSAPEYCSNSIGTPSWSGKHESEFTDQLQSELTNFIVFEAKLQGHNDSVQDRVGENDKFFDNDFLSGWPQLLWDEYYQLGISEQQNPQKTPDYAEIWPSMPI